MTSQAHPSRDRLMAGAVCVAAIVVHYTRVLSGGSFRIFRDLRLDFAAGFFILFLSVCTFICVVPTLHRRNLGQAVAGILLLVLPIWVAGHFLVWIYQVYAL